MTQGTSTLKDMRDMPGACPFCSTLNSATFHYGPCLERNKIRVEVHFHGDAAGSKAWETDRSFEEQITEAIERAVRRAY